MSNDPFQWLEEVESKEALKWVEQWNKKSLDNGLEVVMEKTSTLKSWSFTAGKWKINLKTRRTGK